MPIILGPDTPAVASKIYVEDKSEIQVRDLHGNDYTICVGMSYKHLGSYKDSKRNKAQELSYRAGEASSAAKELFRATRKAEVTPPKNWQLALSLCASRLCYDAHTDSFFTEAQIKKMSSTYDGLARRSVSRKFFHESSRCSAAFARALCVALPAELHLRFARLSYLARLIDTGPLFVLAAIDVLARSPRSFFRLVLDALQWLFEHRGAELGMPDPREEVRDTLDWIGAQTVRWRKLINRSKRATASFLSVTEIASTWHSELLGLCDTYGFPGGVEAEPDGLDQAPQELSHFRCWCGYVAASFPSLVVHATHRHGFRKPEYPYLNDDGYCRGCLQTFHTKFRLLNHLSRSKTKLCLLRLMSNCAPDFAGTPAVRYGRGADGDAVYRSGPPRDRDRYPIIAAKGPLLPIRELNEPLGPTGLAFQRCLPPGGGAHARDKVEGGVPLVRLRINRVLGCVNIFILNLCCGHRRPGDVEDLTARVSFPSFFKVWFISIDIVSGNSEHNLADPGAFERLLVLIRMLVVHGWLIGPPCETWSAVRYVAMLAGRGPRPLRSSEHTWGLEGLSQREYGQISIGNILLRCAALLSVVSSRHGVSGLVEHPDCPVADHLPSIWKLGIFKRLGLHPDAHQFSFKQGSNRYHTTQGAHYATWKQSR